MSCGERLITGLHGGIIKQDRLLPVFFREYVMSLSFDASISGVKAATLRQAVSADDVANINTPGYRQVNVYQTDASPSGTRISNLVRTPNPNPDLSGTDLVEEVKEQKISKTDFMSNLRVLKVKDEMTKDLLDIFA
jgi:flagellar hook protein FlgE